MTDHHRLIPRGAAPGAVVRPLDLQIRFMVDYDTMYMRHRVCADLFANGQPVGIYARHVLPELLEVHELAIAISEYGPLLEREIVARLAGHGNQRRIDALEAQAQQVHEQLAALRRPWWRKAYDKLGSWVSGVR